MSVIQSQHNPNSEESLSNQDFNKKLVEELQTGLQILVKEVGQKWLSNTKKEESCYQGRELKS